MAQQQFISHARVTPPAYVPRNGLGLFGALAIVIIILGGVLTGGLVVLEKNKSESAKKAEEKLTAIHSQIEIESIKSAKALETRINRGKKLLDGHVYSSQVFNLLEKIALSQAYYTSFGYADNQITVGMKVPGYIAYAQQIKILKGIDEIKELTFSEPILDESGGVNFSATLTLDESFLHTKPKKWIAPPPVVAPDNNDENNVEPES